MRGRQSDVFVHVKNRDPPPVNFRRGGKAGDQFILRRRAGDNDPGSTLFLDGRPQDLDMLTRMTRFLGPGNTFCALAPGAMEPLQSALKHFREDFEKYLPTTELAGGVHV